MTGRQYGEDGKRGYRKRDWNFLTRAKKPAMPRILRVEKKLGFKTKGFI